MVLGIILKVIAILSVYGLYWIIAPFFRPIKPKPNSTMLRKGLRSRMRTKGTPHLCDNHARAELAPGQMAVIDNRLCELCKTEKKSA